MKSLTLTLLLLISQSPLTSFAHTVSDTDDSYLSSADSLATLLRSEKLVQILGGHGPILSISKKGEQVEVVTHGCYLSGTYSQSPGKVFKVQQQNCLQ